MPASSSDPRCLCQGRGRIKTAPAICPLGPARDPASIFSGTPETTRGDPARAPQGFRSDTERDPAIYKFWGRARPRKFQKQMPLGPSWAAGPNSFSAVCPVGEQSNTIQLRSPLQPPIPRTPIPIPLSHPTSTPTPPEPKYMQGRIPRAPPGGFPPGRGSAGRSGQAPPERVPPGGWGGLRAPPRNGIYRIDTAAG